MLWPFPGETREEWSDAPKPSLIHWTEDGRFLYATRSADDRWERGLVRYDLNTRQDEDLLSGLRGDTLIIHGHGAS